MLSNVDLTPSHILSWQVDLVLAEEDGKATLKVEEAYCYSTFGSLLYQSSQIAVRCT